MSADKPGRAVYGVIMAGGAGTRFWPLSRRALPKQFLAIGGGDTTLIRATFDRLVPVCGADRILVVANEGYRDLVARALPELGPQRFFGEPVGRNTAPCIGLAAHAIATEDPDAAMLVCPADHVIGPDEAFVATVRYGVGLLDHPSEGDPLTVTIGIPPTYPATGYGYIERGDELGAGAAGGEIAGYRVARFKEKPDVDTATEYVDSGRFFWNSGIFLWTASGAIELVREYLPELAEGLQAIAQAGPDAAAWRAAIGERFGGLPSISIDYGVLERASNVATVTAAFEWDDVGSWGAAAKYYDEVGPNRVKGDHAVVDAENCVLVGGGKRLIAAVGVRDLVVVETDDAVLVCHRDRVEDVKAIVEGLKADERHELI